MLHLVHKSIKTMEKHQAPFVKARQEKMVDELKGLWIKTGVEYTQQHKHPSRAHRDHRFVPARATPPVRPTARHDMLF